MKTEDLKNYIFEQFLTEAKMHPLVMRGAQWVADNIGGDAKKLARRMSTGIKRTTTQPTPEHVYNAAQFHFGEILRKNSPSMDRPEVYADMRKRLRAHLGIENEVNDGEVNETSNFAAGKLADLRRGQATGNERLAARVGREMVSHHQETGVWDEDLRGDRKKFHDRADKAFRSAEKAENRRRGRRGDGSPRTPKQESAFNFINGLKRLTETSDALKQKLIDGRHEQGWTAAKDGDKLFHEYMGQDSKTGKPGKKGEGYGDPALLAVRDIRRKEMKKAWASSDKAKNRLKGLKGDGSPRTPR